MKPLDQLVEIAMGEIGTIEVGGNNLGPDVRKYQKSTWLAPGPWPWCAAFTCWVLREWIKVPEVIMTLRDTVAPGMSSLESWRCLDASAFGWEKWARFRGLQVLPESARAKKGDFIIFDFSHIGIVVEDQASNGNYITTVEGNTNGKGDRDSESGDGVWMKNRRYDLAKSFVRIL